MEVNFVILLSYLEGNFLNLIKERIFMIINKKNQE